MMHKAWSSTEEVPFSFWRSSVKFQGHLALKIVEFDSNWAFPDCNSSLNSPMAMKCCTKLETAKKRCPIVFQGHPSNFKVTWDKTSPILTQIGRFRTIGRSQLSNPSDLPCCGANDDFIQFCSLKYFCPSDKQMEGSFVQWQKGPAPGVRTPAMANPEYQILLCFIIPLLHRRWNGGILDSPRCLSICLSVHPSVHL